jgi:RimJ/RimL family protein N-acetyltransferase
MIIETERLILREMTQEDYSALAAILMDEQTMYAYEGAFREEEVQEWLDKQFLRYKRDGFGLWAIISKETNEMIGQAGITMQEVEGEFMPEIGYLFNRLHWKQGYAAEAAIACKEYAFEKLGLTEIVSIIRDTNIPSMNVAIRNGMCIWKRFVKHYRDVDMPHYVFRVRQSD